MLTKLLTDAAARSPTLSLSSVGCASPHVSSTPEIVVMAEPRGVAVVTWRRCSNIRFSMTVEIFVCQCSWAHREGTRWTRTSTKLSISAGIW